MSIFQTSVISDLFKRDQDKFSSNYVSLSCFGRKIKIKSTLI